MTGPAWPKEGGNTHVDQDSKAGAGRRAACGRRRRRGRAVTFRLPIRGRRCGSGCKRKRRHRLHRSIDRPGAVPQVLAAGHRWIGLDHRLRRSLGSCGRKSFVQPWRHAWRRNERAQRARRAWRDPEFPAVLLTWPVARRSDFVWLSHTSEVIEQSCHDLGALPPLSGRAIAYGLSSRPRKPGYAGLAPSRDPVITGPAFARVVSHSRLDTRVRCLLDSGSLDPGKARIARPE